MRDHAAIDAAAGLVLGDPRPPAAGSVPADVAAVLALLRANKVPLAALERSVSGDRGAAWRDWSELPDVKRALAEEAERSARLLSEWRMVAAAFERNGIRSVLFKSPGWFPFLSSNLDVLVAPSQFRVAAEVLEGLGHVRLPHYREDHKLLFRTFEAGRPSLSVHLHEAVGWGKVTVLEAEGVLDRSLPGFEEGFRVSSPLDALGVTVAHSVYETDQVRLVDLMIAAGAKARGATIVDLLERAARRGWSVAAAAGLSLYDAVGRRAGAPGLLDPGDAEAVERVLSAAAWARRRLRSILDGAQLSLPFPLPRLFSKEILVRQVVADPSRAPEERVADLASTAWNLVATRLRLRQRPASLVTFSGPDGAGKSRLADAVASALELCEVPVARLWSRGGFSAAAVAGKALARRLAPRSVPAPDDETAKIGFLESPWRRRLLIWGLVLEQALVLQKVRLHLIAGRTVVGDRWATDTIADLMARLPGENPRALIARPAAFLLGAAPRPHLAFVIDVPGEVAHARKHDGGTLEGRRRLAEVYASGAAAAGSPSKLDGTLPIDDLAREAVERSLRACFARFAGSAP